MEADRLFRARADEIEAAKLSEALTNGHFFEMTMERLEKRHNPKAIVNCDIDDDLTEDGNDSQIISIERWKHDLITTELDGMDIEGDASERDGLALESCSYFQQILRTHMQLLFDRIMASNMSPYENLFPGADLSFEQCHSLRRRMQRALDET